MCPRGRFRLPNGSACEMRGFTVNRFFITAGRGHRTDLSERRAMVLPDTIEPVVGW